MRQVARSFWRYSKVNSVAKYNWYQTFIDFFRFSTSGSAVLYESRFLEKVKKNVRYISRTVTTTFILLTKWIKRLSDDLWQNIVIFQWRADKLFPDAEKYQCLPTDKLQPFLRPSLLVHKTNLKISIINTTKFVKCWHCDMLQK